jgi:DNA-binding protein HU-beta
MTKKDLVAKLHEETHLSLAQSMDLLNKLGDIIAAELLGGGEVHLPAVGKLYVRARPARTGRNPRTGATLSIPAGKKLSVRATKDLLEALKG